MKTRPRAGLPWHGLEARAGGTTSGSTLPTPKRSVINHRQHGLEARATTALLLLIIGLLPTNFLRGQQVKLVERAPDPHGSPRPARDAHDVPLRTSLYFELGLVVDPKAREAVADEVTVSLQPDGGGRVELLEPGRKFTNGTSGWIRANGDKSLAVYIEPGAALKPSTRYGVKVRVRSPGSGLAGAGLTDAGSWSFMTEAAASVHALDFQLDLAPEPVQWHGQFFCGICNVIFCTQAANCGPTYELMAEARKQHPRAWRLQRDFWLTGTDFRPPAAFTFPSNLPNIVRERETRRIAGIEPHDRDVVLHVEDFFGHEQYGIPTGRAASEDYHPGDEVLIADGIHDSRTKVVAVGKNELTVEPFATPAEGWKIAYEGKLPDREDPDAPGLFAPGGCYLRKFNPQGTACYYWGRLDKEWDLAVRQYGRRVVPNFADAPGDLSRDGRSWTTVKDYDQWHEVAQAIAGHIIDRYGNDALGFTWSIFNEPDLSVLFWHGTWDELQTYYDYTTDAILRAFEDRGYDSSKVFIGGLELGAVFETNLRLAEFLSHCSPRARAEGALPLNAAFADHRLDGKRSRRVEQLCKAHGGKGSPCDFVSIHSYNRSEMMAAKLKRAKEMALQIDPEYYKTLWVDSHEACPNWMPPPDEAAADAYLGDGYFPTWCVDVVHRQLLSAAADARFGYGQTILTVWPPPSNFAGLNAVTRVIHCDDHGVDRTTTVPMPIFHMLNLLSDMGDRYWVLPERTIGGHVVSGFASRDSGGAVRISLYAHDAQDTQSRSDAAFEVALDISGFGWPGPARVEEYRFDRDHNSPYRLIKALPRTSGSYSPTVVEQIRQACQCEPMVGTSHLRENDGRLRLTAHLETNGCDFLVVAPEQNKHQR